MVVKYTPPDLEDTDTVLVEEFDYAPGYNRPRLNKTSIVIDDEPLRDDILSRLFLARTLAVMKAQGYELRTQT